MQGNSLRWITRDAVFLSRTLHTLITNFRHPVCFLIFRLCHSHATIMQCHLTASVNSYSVSSMFLSLLSIFLCVACALGTEFSILSSCCQHPWHCILSFILSPMSLALHSVLHCVTDVLGTTLCPSFCHWCLRYYILSFILSLTSLGLHSWCYILSFHFAIDVLGTTFRSSFWHRYPWHSILSMMSLATPPVLHYVVDVLGTAFCPSLYHWCPWHSILSCIISLMSLALLVLHFVIDVLGTAICPFSFCRPCPWGLAVAPSWRCHWSWRLAGVTAPLPYVPAGPCPSPVVSQSLPLLEHSQWALCLFTHTHTYIEQPCIICFWSRKSKLKRQCTQWLHPAGLAPSVIYIYSERTM